MTTITILLCALVIFISRYLLMDPRVPIRLGERTQRFLAYSSPAVLTAITAPIVFLPEGALALTWHNDYLVAGCFAIGIAYWRKNVLLTTLASLAVFLLLHMPK
ncbi:AzlD domain-containing protein [Vibrio sp. SM6]|uniref:AzlD domain-containing protein n=1 Tax=Vibrio agarilyticus TaxID=2726741 RepID=A0A7X8YIM4_9VIBR|nr:AzlD domain-containing protein [Vibrio agarilyticus]NLS14557.1 AzlD domain-containing protein [Vibrio agarilyticus]